MFDFMRDWDRKDQLRCLDKANSSAIVTALDQKSLEIANWRPTGYYKPSDIRRITAMLFQAIKDAKEALPKAPNSTSDAAFSKQQAVSDLDKRVADGQLYLNAAATAQAAGKLVDAPGFKKWVINSLNAIGEAYVTIAVLTCRVTPLETALGYIMAVVDACRAIVQFVVEAAEDAVKVAGWWWKHRHWFLWGGVLAASGILVYPYARRVRAYLNAGKE